ncbi:class I SAM-dependent methyltransferase [Nitrosococcus watsonii]|uniref:Methyltransferase type 11 n=1 Tax=Nitrosococcus watsoni (strain C-113) TaxID=105559 RepID=D8K9W7_NITWC|nr:class I SAM-dependent methyltransferase [Nitrosococcus watsonii]ADJ29325.1 Methyltransferase type 11 [Nitrosococcus watsonii C-113]
MTAENNCYLASIRTHELKVAMNYLPEGARILEIGAGAGWQAKLLSEHGYHVNAIDVEESRYLSQAVFPVKIYDGYKIPFADNTFDIVFSSNVLEHIPHLDKFQDEIKRVLKSGGSAIHIVPTSTWRFWTFLTHHVYIAKLSFRALKYSVFKFSTMKNSAPLITRRLNLANLIRIILWPHRHGEHGNSLSELYLFSYYGWRRLFKRGGWIIKHTYRTRLFYTGNAIFHCNLSPKIRARLSYALGSSSNIFFLNNDD